MRRTTVRATNPCHTRLFLGRLITFAMNANVMRVKPRKRLVAAHCVLGRGVRKVWENVCGVYL
ncbi:hypothetical protein HanRHA438_Chr16g0778851 [Helianthus annuus]|nr:hypothetical protein HanRHA438_Chr16g0778851 [Helianthus annuus]